MKRYASFFAILSALIVCSAHGAQQPITTITSGTGTSGKTLKQYNDNDITPRLTNIDYNFTDLYTNKAGVSCFANSTAFNTCFPLDWPTGFDTAGDYTVTGAWDFTGATVTGISGSLYTAGTGITISGGVISSTVTTGPGVAAAQANALDSTGGLVSKAYVDAFPDIIFGVGIAVAVNTPAGYDTVSIDADTTPTSESAKPLTSGGAYTALSGKENADPTLIKVAEVNSQSKFETLLGWAIPTGGGSFAFDTFPAYEDSAHSSGIAVNGTTLAVYNSTAGKWLTVGLTDTLNAAPSTYTLTIDGTGWNGTDLISVGGSTYTADGTKTGLYGTTSITVTQDTGREAICSGTGITGSSSPYSADMSADRTIACTFSDIASSIVADDFNRADGALGSNWTTITGLLAPVITSNAVTNSSGSGWGAIYTGAPFSNNQYVAIKVIDATAEPNPMVRVSDSSLTGYMMINTLAGEIRIYKVVSGSFTRLDGAGYAHALASGDIIGLKVSGTSTLTLTATLNGYDVLTATDSSSVITGGSPGFRSHNGANNRIDDFEAGDL